MSLTVATAMLGKEGVFTYAKSCNEDKLPFDEITRISQDIKKDKKSQIDLVDFIQKKYYADLGKVALSNICTILGGEVSTGGKLSFTASSKEIEDIRSRIIKFQSSIRSRIGLQGIKEKGSSKLDFVAPPEFDLLSSDKDFIDNHIKESILGLIQDTLMEYFPRTFFFPSERASLPLIFRQLTESSSSSNDEWTPSLPLRRYMNVLNHLLVWGELFDSRDGNIRAELSDIFKNITQDKISLSQSDSSLTNKIYIVTKDESAIDINASSSSIKSLAGFALYLQYRAMPDDVIVIDEPEQNLHPTQQAKFIEFLSLLVNRGFQVALTTHSPYIIEHLQNLIYAYDITDKEEAISQLYLKQADSLIDKEKIGVYLFQNGTAENIIEDGTINWQTFCDTANNIGNITSLVYEKRETSMKKEGM